MSESEQPPDYQPPDYVTSPTLPTDAGIVTSPKAFSDGLTLDLTDDEIQRALKITLEVRTKYQAIFRRKFGPHGNFTVEEVMKDVERFEDEIKTRLAESLDLLVSVDVAPILNGDPPIITFEGALSSHSSARYGLDHEKKMSQVKKAKELGQVFLGVDKLNQ